VQPVQYDKLETYFLTVVPEGWRGTGVPVPFKVRMYAARTAGGPACYQSSARSWEQHRIHLVRTAGVKDEKLLEQTGFLLQQGRTAQIPDVRLTQTQLQQLGFELIK
jgi:hypothetical protein